MSENKITGSASDELSRILNLLQRPVVAWMPYKDEGADQPHTVAGTVAKVARQPGKYNDKKQVIIVELDPGADLPLWRVAGFATVLNNELTAVNPKVGDLLGVSYVGQSTGGARDPYPLFRLHHKRAAGNDDSADDTVVPPVAADDVDDRPPTPSDVPVYGDSEPF